MAKRTIDPHLTPHPILPGRAVSGRILPTGPMIGAIPPPAPMRRPSAPPTLPLGARTAHILPSLPPMMVAAVKPRGGRPAPKPALVKAKTGVAKTGSSRRARGKK